MKRKIMALSLTAILALSSFQLTFAETATEQAIVTVRESFDIPQNLQNVKFDTSNYNGDEQISVRWSDEENNSTFSATLDKHQCINNVHYYSSYYDNDEDMPSSGNRLSKDTAIEMSENQLERIYGKENAKNFRLNKQKLRINSDSINLYFDFVKNNIVVPECAVYISYNRNEACLSNFSGVCKEKLNANFVSPDGIITDNNRIFESYIANDENNIRLCYQPFYDYKTNSTDVRAVYTIQPVLINAFNGKEVTGDKDNDIYGYTKNAAVAEDAEEAMTSESGGAARYELSEYEKQAVSDFSKLITAEKGDKIAKNFFPVLKNMQVTRSNIYSQNYRNEPKTILHLGYETDNCYAYVTLDAENGEVQNFDYSDYKNKKEKAVTNKDAAAQTADNLIKAIAPKIYESKQYKVEDFSYEHNNDIYFTYNRTYNDIPVNSQQLSVTVDSGTGYVTNYSKRWDKLDFPSLDKAILPKEAFENAKQYGFGLKYVFSDNTPVLAYGFDSGPQMIFDAKSGERLNGNGTPYVSQTKGEYTDLEGSKYKQVVETLAEYGYYLDGTEFKPDNEITIKEFYDFMGYRHYEFYDVIRKSRYSDVPLNLFTDKQAEKTLTKYDMAKIFVFESNYYELALHNEIFNNVYDDVDDENNGFVAICNAMGYITKQQDNFNGSKKLTRGEAAEYLYTCLVANNEI